MILEPRQEPKSQQETWPRFFDVGIIEDGQALAIMLREFDGTISAIRIGIEQLAD
jgi:hypothetical protein